MGNTQRYRELCLGLVIKNCLLTFTINDEQINKSLMTHNDYTFRNEIHDSYVFLYFFYIRTEETLSFLLLICFLISWTVPLSSTFYFDLLFLIVHAFEFPSFPQPYLFLVLTFFCLYWFGTTLSLTLLYFLFPSVSGVVRSVTSLPFLGKKRVERLTSKVLLVFNIAVRR